uniref:Uncharacterized protein n=1 Tax=Lactuca sativa TaxID=4236 RepID=A0A9R1VES9_LACSA|nr:hypothetical protein LSAT_V11C500277720 [Lactuca sativa]
MPLASSSPFVGYVDLYGKRRQAARVQDEIKSLGSIGLASSSCKDELLPFNHINLLRSRNPKNGGSKNFLKILGRKFSCLSWMCCFCGSCCGSHISCCCDVKKSCSWRLCKCCKISCRCSFDLSCPKYSIRK